MSKESFSERVHEIMCKKIQAIENMNLQIIFEKNKDFEVAMCLAYMTLSKESIIESEMKNKNGLERLKQKVDTSEIEKIFDPGFAEEMPNIIYTKENNNLWILNSIRNSIMHGAFNIDESKKCFLINNTLNNRELIAEIPFSWFIAYAKNDILSKKKSNIYTFKNYYYNNKKKNQNLFDTKKELISSILYKVTIYGNNFNIIEIENRINELFLSYSSTEISYKMIEKYRTEIDAEYIKYDKQYLTSFYMAKQKVIDIINQEYPNIGLKIFIENRKYRIINKTIKKTSNNFYEYNTMFNTLNHILSPKDVSLFKFISRIIENFNIGQTINELYLKRKLDLNEKIKLLHKLLTGIEITNQKKDNLNQIKNQDSQILRSIYLNVYGLSTLVINRQKYYNPSFITRKPYEFGMLGISKTIYIEYAKRRKTLIMKKLNNQIILDNLKQQLSKCNDEIVKEKIRNKINDVNTSILKIKSQISNLDTVGLNQIIKSDGASINYQKKQFINENIKKYLTHFNNTNIIAAKQKIRKIIGELLDKEIEETSKYTYTYCNNMKDILTIIRNCFAHIGRIQIGQNKDGFISVILSDYDSNGEKSGEILCNYVDLIELLSNPYKLEKKINKHKRLIKLK